MCTHKHTSHIPVGSKAFPLIIFCSGCHSNPCSQVSSWTSFTRHQNIFLHCSHWKNRVWIGSEWPAVRTVGKDPENTYTTPIVGGDKWRKTASVSGVTYQQRVSLHVGPLPRYSVGFWVPRGKGVFIKRAHLLVPKMGLHLPANPCSLSALWLAGFELARKFHLFSFSRNQNKKTKKLMVKCQPVFLIGLFAPVACCWFKPIVISSAPTAVVLWTEPQVWGLGVRSRIRWR